MNNVAIRTLTIVVPHKCSRQHVFFPLIWQVGIYEHQYSQNSHGRTILLRAKIKIMTIGDRSEPSEGRWMENFVLLHIPLFDCL